MNFMEVGAQQHQSSRLWALVRGTKRGAVPVLGKSLLLLSRAGECHANFNSKTVAVFFHSKTIFDYFPLSSVVAEPGWMPGAQQSRSVTVPPQLDRGEKTQW